MNNIVSMIETGNLYSSVIIGIQNFQNMFMMNNYEHQESKIQVVEEVSGIVSQYKFNTFVKIKHIALDEFVEKLHDKNSFHNYKDCAICREDFTPDSNIVILPHCNHYFDESCIKIWLTEKISTCPLCRYSYK